MSVYPTFFQPTFHPGSLFPYLSTHLSASLKFLTKLPNFSKGRLRGMVTYEDLEEENQLESSALKITDKNQFCQGLAVETTKVWASVSRLCNQWLTRCEA